MRDKTVLIKALRDAASKAEMNPNAYHWMSMTRCNCGLVAQQILGEPVKVTRVLDESRNVLGFECGWEQAGVAGNITVSFPGKAKFTRATPIDLRGQITGKPVRIINNKFSFSLGAYRPESFLLE